MGNSARAFLLGHDDADYYVAAVGGEVGFQPYSGILQDGRAAIAFERQESAPAESALPLSGRFQPNRSITDGDFVRATLEKSWLYGLNGANRFTVGGDALLWDNVSTGRVWAAAQITRRDAKTLAMLRVRGGAVTGDDLPQMRYRVGGPKTVRGYTYGEATGRTLWSARLTSSTPSTSGGHRECLRMSVGSISRRTRSWGRRRRVVRVGLGTLGVRQGGDAWWGIPFRRGGRGAGELLVSEVVLIVDRSAIPAF